MVREWGQIPEMFQRHNWLDFVSLEYLNNSLMPVTKVEKQEEEEIWSGGQ